MSKSSSSAALKRKQPEPRNLKPPELTEQGIAIYELIRSKREKGMIAQDISSEAKICEKTVDNCIKSLIGRKLIKQIPNKDEKKMYIAVEIERIEKVKKQCMIQIGKLGVATIGEIVKGVSRPRVLDFKYPTTKIHQIVKTLVLSNQLVEVRSTGLGEFSSKPEGVICYKFQSQKTKTSALASIPCGVCPYLSICTPGGRASPSNCVYFDKWLDF